MSVIKKTRTSSLVTTRKIVSHEHLNPNGILFGGYLMCWIDEIAFLCACQYSGKKSCVTVNIDNISFKYPLKLGEHLFLSAQVIHSGKTSMEVEVKVEKEISETGKRQQTNSAHLTFVCLGKDLRPTAVPELVPENIEDETIFWQARLRIKVRKRLTAFLERKLKEDKLFMPQTKLSKQKLTGRNVLRRAMDLKQQLTINAMKKKISLLLEL